MAVVEETRPFWIEVDLDAVAHNTRTLRQRLGNAHLMAVVKADGYGHGAVPIARAALANGAAWLGVATVREGIQLREAGLLGPILVLAAPLPTDARDLVGYALTAAVSQWEDAEALAAAAREAGVQVRVHVKVDTGMGRFGLLPEDTEPFLRRLTGIPGVEVQGLFTHLATADEEDTHYTQQQLHRFDHLIRQLQDQGLCPPLCHAANSAGILAHPAAHYDLGRSGLSLYGLYPSAHVRRESESLGLFLRPALSLKSRISAVKRLPAGWGISYGHTYALKQATRVAVIPMGYADGLTRLLSHKLHVLIGGAVFPVVGRICMNQCMVEVGSAPVALGDEVVLLGTQGSAAVTADEWAAALGTVNYEVVCLVGSRAPRVYRERVGPDQA